MNKICQCISYTLILGVVVLPLADMCRQAYNELNPRKAAVVSYEHAAKQQASLPKISKFIPKYDVPMDGNDLGPSDLPPERATKESHASTDTITGLIPGDNCPALQSDEIPTPRAQTKPKDRRALVKIVDTKETPSNDHQKESAHQSKFNPHA